MAHFQWNDRLAQLRIKTSAGKNASKSMRNESGTCKLPAILEKNTEIFRLNTDGKQPFVPSFYNPPSSLPRRNIPCCCWFYVSGLSSACIFRREEEGSRLGRRDVRNETSAAGSIPSLEMSCSFSKFSTYSFSQQATFFAYGSAHHK
jgi:hypothetical protein